MLLRNGNGEAGNEFLEMRRLWREWISTHDGVSGEEARMTGRDNRQQAIWAAIEKIADMRGLTPSGLAKLAGLDAPAFNKSKRVKRNGVRWPSTETPASSTLQA